MANKVKYKLPKVFKKKWVAALRSGKYNQARFALYDVLDTSINGTKEHDYGYCCLGIAGLVCGIPKEKMYFKSTLSEKEMVPLAKANKMPEMFYIRKFEYDEIIAKLVSFNDSKKRSFKWIASYIERYL